MLSEKANLDAVFASVGRRIELALADAIPQPLLLYEVQKLPNLPH
jgi:hypothetical protein